MNEHNIELRKACWLCDVDGIKRAIFKGADMWQPDNMGFNAVHLSLMSENPYDSLNALIVDYDKKLKCGNNEQLDALEKIIGDLLSQDDQFVKHWQLCNVFFSDILDVQKFDQ